MTLRKVCSSAAFIALLAIGTLTTGTAFGGLITVSNGSITNGASSLTAVSGTAPNGSTWASYVTGTTPVAYFDLSTGSLMFDPKGRSINLVDFKYGTAGTISSTTSGPMVFTTGTAQQAISTSLVEKTLPAGTWAAVTTFPARLGASISLTNTPTLSTSGSNIASTDGSFNLAWSFGAIAPSLINSQATLYSTTAGQGFRSATSGGDLLGYGSGIGMISYVEFGGTTKYSVLVPVQAVPEPTTLALAGVGVASAGYASMRRRRKAHAAAAASIA